MKEVGQNPKGDGKKKDDFRVHRVEHIHKYYAEAVEINVNDPKRIKRGQQNKPLCLRLVFYRDDKDREYKLITNNWEITPESIATPASVNACGFTDECLNILNWSHFATSSLNSLSNLTTTIKLNIIIKQEY